jgi:pimeloyl-ACP methyl ester carboxylesterase
MVQRFGGLAAEVSGARSRAPALVLLHGLTFDHSMWDPIVGHVSSLDPDRLVVTFDLPGHGESDAQDDYTVDAVDAVAATVHRAVTEADLGAPVVVGHSVSGITATVYAARYPARGVVNVDQPLDMTAFAQLVRSFEDRLRGPDFAQLWARFEASFHTELLPASGQELLRSTSRPHQDLVLGYWRQVFEVSPEALNTMVDDALAELRARKVHFTFVSGSTVDPNYEQWLTIRLPQAHVVSWPDSSHFPHLAHPKAFARILADTRGW